MIVTSAFHGISQLFRSSFRVKMFSWKDLQAAINCTAEIIAIIVIIILIIFLLTLALNTFSWISKTIAQK